MQQMPRITKAPKFHARHNVIPSFYKFCKKFGLPTFKERRPSGGMSSGTYYYVPEWLFLICSYVLGKDWQRLQSHRKWRGPMLASLLTNLRDDPDYLDAAEAAFDAGVLRDFIQQQKA
jgi:hypothetical protein